ncbi:hypothetical protein D0X99_16855 [Algoriphagus lacus]|uniref:Class I SAM-dependent methyltransferase n=1 Tax=Algoriphagus lacus TaxID=2056311 RepID=A0A418PN97_9BACT|nr:hypothetical protein [Algoriphagus lacus]RIW13080.1 hypothetical protein D0X99_16855 [Algoriphagus lacus]
MKFFFKRFFKNSLIIRPGLLNNFSFWDLITIPFIFNVNKTTLLCEYMLNEGSDKGVFAGQGRHNYTPIYHSLFRKFRNKEILLFELGLGTSDKKFDSNMGPNGKPGASLRAWRKYFPYAKVFGADIDYSILFQEDRIKTFFCDQTNPISINEMWVSNSELNKEFDIIIEDGLHVFSANKIFLENSFNKLKSNGIYVIEDVSRSEISSWVKYLPEFSISRGNVRYMILKIPNEFNPHDNNLILIFKPGFF